jgi:type 1 glutamine amidotransferase
MKKNALIVQGGWEGHQPKKTAELFKEILESCGFLVDMEDSLDAFSDKEKLTGLHLIVPVWTNNYTDLTAVQTASLLGAVQEGVGFAGSHGVGDSFRFNVSWQFLVGGQFVGHTSGIEEAAVSIVEPLHPIMTGIQDFSIADEYYYMHIDPAVQVLATTRYPKGYYSPAGDVDMPVIWVKHHGKGRVFYCSLGHSPEFLKKDPIFNIMKQGFIWAAEGKGDE